MDKLSKFGHCEFLTDYILLIALNQKSLDFKLLLYDSTELIVKFIFRLKIPFNILRASSHVSNITYCIVNTNIIILSQFIRVPLKITVLIFCLVMLNGFLDSITLYSKFITVMGSYE